MPLTGVAGWPVGHSRSPALHRAAFLNLGLEGWESQLLPIVPELFEETVRALPAEGFVGVNVTIPHKREALRIADTASAQAEAIGAANTLTFRDGQIFAANTDAPAIEAAIRNRFGQNLPTSVLILGAGGSARAAAFAVLELGIEDPQFLSRTRSRTEQLTDQFGGRVVAIPEPADLLINCTPIGLDSGGSEQLAELGLGEEALANFGLVCDLVYRDGGTDLTNGASKAGCKTIGGLEILARQGALSVEIWTQLKPDLEVIEAAVAAAS